MSTREWIKPCVDRVSQNLLSFFQEQGNDQLKKPLREHPLLLITEDVSQAMKNFKEPWVMANCKKAMISTTNFEASGSLFWLECVPSQKDFPGFRVSWSQLHAARQNWNEASLLSSSTQQCYQRYEFPGVYLTWIDSLAPIERANSMAQPYLTDLPLIVTRTGVVVVRGDGHRSDTEKHEPHFQIV